MNLENSSQKVQVPLDERSLEIKQKACAIRKIGGLPDCHLACGFSRLARVDSEAEIAMGAPNSLATCTDFSVNSRKLNGLCPQPGSDSQNLTFLTLCVNMTVKTIYSGISISPQKENKDLIEITNLTKTYDTVTALKDLTLTIPSGQIFGFLGHNGAGKSTTIKCLTSIIEPTSGSIKVDGAELNTNRQTVKQRIGYVPDTPDLFLQLTANEYWELIASAFNLTEAQKTAQLSRLTQLFDFSDKGDSTIESFSHGMRQKAIVIGALLSNPDIWILDEPLQGLDPQAAFDLKELMRAHAAQGKTVIFSTHALEVAQQLCDQVAILKAGELIYTGSVDQLLEQAGNDSLEAVYLRMAGRQSENAQNQNQETGTAENSTEDEISEKGKQE